MLRNTKDSYKYFLEIQTRWNDNDMYGHVNNAVYYTWFDTLVNNFLIENGLLDPQTSKIIGLVVGTGCQYYAPLSYPEIISAGLRTGKVGSSSVRYEIGLFRGGEDKPCAEGHFIHVYVDAGTRKPQPISADMRTKLGVLM
ncbi:MAG: acyl-CoA thioesterase [Robiginitomaculum sp.]|nr:acyl-CoA thioesterase [Robiginitomaculum sp.]